MSSEEAFNEAAALEIMPQLKEALANHEDGTYDIAGLLAHFITIVRPFQERVQQTRVTLEKLMYDVDRLREAQRLYWGGHKSKIGECKQLERAIDEKIMALQSMGYKFERYKTKQNIQNALFK